MFSCLQSLLHKEKHVYKVYYTKKNMFTKFTTQRKHVYEKKFAKAYFYNKSLKKIASYS